MGATGFNLRTGISLRESQASLLFYRCEKGLNLVLSKSEAVLPGSDEDSEPNWLYSRQVILPVTV